MKKVFLPALLAVAVLSIVSSRSEAADKQCSFAFAAGISSGGATLKASLIQSTTTHGEIRVLQDGNGVLTFISSGGLSHRPLLNGSGFRQKSTGNGEIHFNVILGTGIGKVDLQLVKARIRSGVLTYPDGHSLPITPANDAKLICSPAERIQGSPDEE